MYIVCRDILVRQLHAVVWMWRVHMTVTWSGCDCPMLCSQGPESSTGWGHSAGWGLAHADYWLWNCKDHRYREGTLYSNTSDNWRTVHLLGPTDYSRYQQKVYFLFLFSCGSTVEMVWNYCFVSVLHTIFTVLSKILNTYSRCRS